MEKNDLKAWTKVYLKEKSTYLEASARLKLSHAEMIGENWGFEVTIRALDVTAETRILKLPNGYDVIYKPETGEISIDQNVLFACS